MPSLKNLHISFFLTILAIAPLVHSQAPGYEPPRTEYGVPDLQGIWTNRSITRMERNPLIDDGLVLTEERAYEMAQGSFWMSLDRQQQNNPITEAKAVSPAIFIQLFGRARTQTASNGSVGIGKIMLSRAENKYKPRRALLLSAWWVIKR